MSPPYNPACFLARHGVSEGPMPVCDGWLRRLQLIPRAVLEEHLPPPRPSDLSSNHALWVLACQRHLLRMGNGDLRVPRQAIPAWTEDIAARVGLTWWLDREYEP